MRERTIFFTVIFLAVVIVLAIILTVMILPEIANVEISELQKKVETLQYEATGIARKAEEKQSALIERMVAQQVSFTATQQAMVEGAAATTTAMSRDYKTIANEATGVSKIATEVTDNFNGLAATATSLSSDYKTTVNEATGVSKTATVVADDFNKLATTATARAPITVKVKEGETISLFGQELDITLDGYSGFFSSKVTFTVHSRVNSQ